RNLPPKDVTPENIGNRYLEFILYCNPSAPSDLDVSSLIRSFNAVPKSDGKTFETWVLFQLVAKHHSGEIKTWTKLAQQLGVERTNESSPQKIQQYAVRLKPNEYYDEPNKNPTGAEPPSSSGADDLDESDLVLKLIRRASNKRQKRKYTRRNNSGSTDSGNNGGNVNDGDEDDEEDDDLDLDDGDAKSEKHRGKRIKSEVAYSDRSDEEPDEDEDRDAWEDVEDVMHIDNPTASSSKNVDGKKAGSLRKKNVTHVQFASTRENIPKLGKPKHIITHNIPTPNPSPTTMPDIKLNYNPSGGAGETGNLRMVPSPSAAGSPGTPQLRWRSIAVGGGPTSAQAGDVPNSQSRKQSGDTLASGHFDSFRIQSKRQQKQQSPQQDRQSVDSNWAWNTNSASNSSSGTLGGLAPEASKDNNDSGSYAEMLIPPTNVSNDPNVMINLLQEKLVKAVGMLEENQREISMLKNVVRQREEE
ncbi:10855_t:CDS:2, partial [Acaulospora colombiana]